MKFKQVFILYLIFFSICTIDRINAGPPGGPKPDKVYIENHKEKNGKYYIDINSGFFILRWRVKILNVPSIKYQVRVFKKNSNLEKDPPIFLQDINISETRFTITRSMFKNNWNGEVKVVLSICKKKIKKKKIKNKYYYYYYWAHVKTFKLPVVICDLTPPTVGDPEPAETVQSIIQNGKYYLGTSTFQLHWDKGKDPGSSASGIKNYQVYLNDELYTTTAANNCSINLNPDKENSIYIKVFDNEGNSSQSQVKVFRIADKVDKVSFPAEAVSYYQKNNGIFVKWNPVSNNIGIKNHEVVINHDNTQPAGEVSKIGNLTSYFFKIDWSNKNYFWIRAVNQIGVKGEWALIEVPDLSVNDIQELAITRHPVDKSKITVKNYDVKDESGIKNYHFFIGLKTDNPVVQKKSRETEIDMIVPGWDKEYNLYIRAVDNCTDLKPGGNQGSWTRHQIPDLGVNQINPADISIVNGKYLRWKKQQDINSPVKYRLGLTKSHNLPGENELLTEKPVLSNNYNLPFLPATNSYYIWIQTIDKIGNTSEWISREFEVAPGNINLTAKAESLIHNNQAGYQVTLTMSESRVDQYILERQETDKPDTRKLLKKISLEELKNNNFTYLDQTVEKHKSYTYFAHTEKLNADGKILVSYKQEMAKVTIPNIKAELEQIKLITPADNLITNQLKHIFKITSQQDIEGDQIEYSLMARKKGEELFANLELAPPDSSCVFTDNEWEWYLEIGEYHADKLLDTRQTTINKLIIDTARPTGEFKIRDRENNTIYNREVFAPTKQVKISDLKLTDNGPVKSGLQKIYLWNGINRPLNPAGYSIEELKDQQNEIAWELADGTPGERVVSMELIDQAGNSNIIYQIVTLASQSQSALINFSEGDKILVVNTSPANISYSISQNTRIFFKLIAPDGTSTESQTAELIAGTHNYPFTFSQPGLYQLTAYTGNSPDQPDLTRVQMIRANQPPQILCPLKLTTTPGAPLILQPEQVTDPENDIPLTYNWKFGDKIPDSSLINPVHHYFQKGKAKTTNYTAQLTVTDNQGKSSQSDISIIVENTSQGKLYADEFWSGEHLITGDVIVPAGLKLTILAGAQIKVTGNYQLLIEEGAELIVSGTEQDSVEMALAPGVNTPWKGILVKGKAEIKQICIKNSVRGLTIVNQADAVIENSSFEQNKIAIHAYSSNPVIRQCKFIGNTNYAIKEDQGAQPQVVTCSFNSNTHDYYQQALTIITGRQLNKINNNTGNTTDKEELSQ